MIIYLDFEVVIKLNCFPFKGDFSPYYIPLTIVDYKTLEYKIHCKILFRAFDQENNDNTLKNSIVFANN